MNRKSSNECAESSVDLLIEQRRAAGQHRRERGKEMRKALALGLFLAMIVPAALAQNGCEANFKELAGGKIYMSFVLIPHLNARSAIGEVQRIGSAAGYKVLSEQYMQMYGQITLSKPSAPRISAVASESGGRLTAQVTTGMGDPLSSDQARTTLCDLLSQVDVDVASGAEKNRPDSSVASAPAAVANSAQAPAARPAPTSQAADDRGVAPELNLKILRPSSAFDAVAAKAALEPGTSTIRGAGCVRRRGFLFLAAKQHVYLYPDSAYIQEALKLMQKVKPDRERLEIDPAALAARIDGMTNANGEFQFTRLKPGRYYLFTTISSNISGVSDVNTGSTVDNNGDITEWHAWMPYTNQYTDVLHKDVEVKQDGQTVSVTLTPSLGTAWIPAGIKESGTAGVFGCTLKLGTVVR